VHVIGKKIPLEAFNFALSINLETESSDSVIDKYMNTYGDMYRKVGQTMGEDDE